jgi:flagellar hook protein FlgE
MGLSSAMNVGISGLGTNADAITVVGNNIANVNTIGFKEGRTLFSDILSQNVASGQVGRGGQVQAIQNNFNQSSFENSTNVTDLAIQGNSFFALKDPSITGAITQNQALLSRAGSFSVNEKQYLVNPDGFQAVDTSGKPIQFPDKAAALLPVLVTLSTQITSSDTSMLAATAPAIYSTPSTTASTDLAAAKTAATTARTSAIAARAAAVDAGSQAAADIAISRAVTAETNIQAAIDLSSQLTNTYSTAATTAATALTGAQTAFLGTGIGSANGILADTANRNAKGALSTAQDTMVALKTAMDTAVTSLNDAGTALTATGNAMNSYSAGTGATYVTDGGTASVAATTLNTATTTFGTALITATATYNAAIVNCNIASGTFDTATAQAYSKVAKVGTDGLITFTGLQGDTYYYSASGAIGIPTGTASVNQIATVQRIATVKTPNPNGLEKMGGSLYKISTSAGVPGTAFSLSGNKLNGSSDQILSNSQEQSNVDMATQLVNMIKLQRAYSGNSKTITSSDEMMQETLNLKR